MEKDLGALTVTGEELEDNHREYNNNKNKKIVTNLLKIMDFIIK